MEIIEELFEKIKNSEDSEAINDLLIELGNNPKEEYLSYVEYFMKNCKPSIINDIKINLIYVLGQIGRYKKVTDTNIEYLYEEYFKSDRWVRNEILNALDLIAINKKLPEKIMKNVENALVDEYLPIRINALSIVLHFDSLPNSLMKKLIGILSSSESRLLDSCGRVFKKFIINDNQLFEILSQERNFMDMDKHSIRRLLIIYFKSIFDLENFRKLIIYSNWDNVSKETFLKELYTFEQILLKNL